MTYLPIILGASMGNMEINDRKVLQKCICYDLPPKGRFLIGKEYVWEYVIDGIVVEDEDGDEIDFNNEISLLYYFIK